jgi:hypothetical protein
VLQNNLVVQIKLSRTTRIKRNGYVRITRSLSGRDWDLLSCLTPGLKIQCRIAGTILTINLYSELLVGFKRSKTTEHILSSGSREEIIFSIAMLLLYTYN